MCATAFASFLPFLASPLRRFPSSARLFSWLGLTGHHTIVQFSSPVRGTARPQIRNGRDPSTHTRRECKTKEFHQLPRVGDAVPPFPFPLFPLQVSLARSRFRSSSFLPPPPPMVLLSHTDVVRSSCRSRVRGRPRSGGGAEATEGRKEGQNERTKLRGRNRTPNVGTKRININGEGERRSMKNGAKISGQD